VWITYQRFSGALVTVSCSVMRSDRQGT
jgi:hypothetical protein